MRVAVWGTGNVGRPAIRSVLAHSELELSHVIVSSEAKVGLDVADIVSGEKVGLVATRDVESVLEAKPDAVVYTVNAAERPMESLQEVVNCLRSGVNVVTTSLYALAYPETAPPEMLAEVVSACNEGNSSLFVNGIDPGWALDSLPVLLVGASAGVTEIRCRELFNYATYDAPDNIRTVIGFGRPMTETPLMLTDMVLLMVWEPMVRILAERLGIRIDSVKTKVERRELEEDVAVPGMGIFEKGTQGAFRFEVIGVSGEYEPIVVEHVTRIDDGCAPDWPYPPEGLGCHQVIVSGQPNIVINIHAEDAIEPGPAAGGNATAANRLVNAIQDVCAAVPGVVTAADLPMMSAPQQAISEKRVE